MFSLLKTNGPGPGVRRLEPKDLAENLIRWSHMFRISSLYALFRISSLYAEFILTVT